MERINITQLLITVVSLVVGLIAGFYIRRFLAEARISSAEAEATKILNQAKQQVENQSKEILVAAKEEAHNIKSQGEADLKQRRKEVERVEDRLLQREELLEEKINKMEGKEKELIEARENTNSLNEELKLKVDGQKAVLEKISGMSSEEAKKMQIELMENDLKRESVKIIKEMEEKTREESTKKAQEIISLAIQRSASEHTAETTVSVVPIPSDDMKGRIIGREGRNIRSIETLTGVNLIIDDTPEAITVSGFDPIRREIAKVCLENLILDGRIHPAKIEEMYLKAKREIESRIKEAGNEAVYEMDLRDIHPEIIRVLGRLQFRTSYGQNVLKHSLEVARLAGLLASELNVNVPLAKRGGMLHDIGKAVDKEIEGNHAIIGSELAKRLGESDDVCNIIEAHHEEREPQTVEAVLVLAADAISAARPGARREIFETYIKRLEKLESIADSFEGVEKVFAIQAGREVRVMVKPEDINDEQSIVMAREIAKQIEDELQYPGQIRVTVVRESRATEYAK